MYTIGIHCVESVRIRSYSGLHFSRIFPYSVRMRENEEKMRTRITPNTDTYFIRSDIVKDLLIIATEDIHKKNTWSRKSADAE